MNIGTYSYEEYLHLAKSFHGSLAPGLAAGGVIVDLAIKNLPAGEFFDAICETTDCIPDVVQLLTPCTIGNGRLHVVDIGRFAVTLFEQKKGEGIRVYLDTGKIKAWPEFNAWHFKLKCSKEQDFDLLMAQIKQAGAKAMSMQYVRVKPEYWGKLEMGEIASCPACVESFSIGDGSACLSCRTRIR